MSESKICTICGGYIGNATLAPSTTSTVAFPTIRFCPGHSITDAELYRPLTTIYTPSGLSIFPPDPVAFWKIVEAVAEEDSAYHDSNDDLYHCPFCNTATDNFIDPFPHDKECIVVKARELMAWREAQPKISIRTAEVPCD